MQRGARSALAAMGLPYTAARSLLLASMPLFAPLGGGGEGSAWGGASCLAAGGGELPASGRTQFAGPRRRRGGALRLRSDGGGRDDRPWERKRARMGTVPWRPAVLPLRERLQRQPAQPASQPTAAAGGARSVAESSVGSGESRSRWRWGWRRRRRRQRRPAPPASPEDPPVRAFLARGLERRRPLPRSVTAPDVPRSRVPAPAPPERVTAVSPRSLAREPRRPQAILPAPPGHAIRAALQELQLAAAVFGAAAPDGAVPGGAVPGGAGGRGPGLALPGVGAAYAHFAAAPTDAAAAESFTLQQLVALDADLRALANAGADVEADPGTDAAAAASKRVSRAIGRLRALLLVPLLAARDRALAEQRLTFFAERWFPPWRRLPKLALIKEAWEAFVVGASGAAGGGGGAAGGGGEDDGAGDGSTRVAGGGSTRVAGGGSGRVAGGGSGRVAGGGSGRVAGGGDFGGGAAAGGGGVLPNSGAAVGGSAAINASAASDDSAASDGIAVDSGEAVVNGSAVADGGRPVDGVPAVSVPAVSFPASSGLTVGGSVFRSFAPFAGADISVPRRATGTWVSQLRPEGAQLFVGGTGGLLTADLRVRRLLRTSASPFALRLYVRLAVARLELAADLCEFGVAAAFAAELRVAGLPLLWASAREAAAEVVAGNGASAGGGARGGASGPASGGTGGAASSGLSSGRLLRAFSHAMDDVCLAMAGVGGAGNGGLMQLDEWSETELELLYSDLHDRNSPAEDSSPQRMVCEQVYAKLTARHCDGTSTEVAAGALWDEAARALATVPVRALEAPAATAAPAAAAAPAATAAGVRLPAFGPPLPVSRPCASTTPQTASAAVAAVSEGAFFCEENMSDVNEGGVPTAAATPETALSNTRRKRRHPESQPPPPAAAAAVESLAPHMERSATPSVLGATTAGATIAGSGAFFGATGPNARGGGDAGLAALLTTTGATPLERGVTLASYEPGAASLAREPAAASSLTAAALSPTLPSESLAASPLPAREPPPARGLSSSDADLSPQQSFDLTGRPAAFFGALSFNWGKAAGALLRRYSRVVAGGAAAQGRAVALYGGPPTLWALRRLLCDGWPVVAVFRCVDVSGSPVGGKVRFLTPGAYIPPLDEELVFLLVVRQQPPGRPAPPRLTEPLGREEEGGSLQRGS